MSVSLVVVMFILKEVNVISLQFN